MAQCVLVVDDEKTIRTAVEMIVGKKHPVITAGKGLQALELFRTQAPDLVLLDIGLPDMDGMDVLREMRERDPEALVIMVTAVEEIKTVVEAIKLGAYDYLVKPVNSQELELTVDNALENKRLKTRIEQIQKPNVRRYHFDLMGGHPRIRAAVEIGRKVSRSPQTPVLITGESGSGKGMMAKAIHFAGGKDPGPFVTVNCGAMAKDLVESELFGYERGAFTGAAPKGKKGYFEEASGGTLLLDEIGAMPLDAQVKLLGVLEDRIYCRVGNPRPQELSCRIIAATNADLETFVRDGQFRADLYHRLNVVKIEMPPLRERQEDIPLLAERFMADFNIKFGKGFREISPSARDFLLGYHWPGNVRELRNALERIILLEVGETVTRQHFLFLKEQKQPFSPPPIPIPIQECISSYETMTKNLIQETLGRTGGNVVAAARILRIPAHKIRYRIKKLDMKKPQADSINGRT